MRRFVRSARAAILARFACALGGGRNPRFAGHGAGRTGARPLPCAVDRRRRGWGCAAIGAGTRLDAGVPRGRCMALGRQVTRPGAPNRGAERLRQRARARTAAEQAEDARHASDEAASAALSAQTELEAAQGAEADARELEKQSQAALAAARSEEAALTSEAGRIEALLAAQRPSLDRLTAELADAEAAAAAIALSVAALPDRATLLTSRSEAEQAEAEASRSVTAARSARTPPGARTRPPPPPGKACRHKQGKPSRGSRRLHPNATTFRRRPTRRSGD